MHGLLNHPSLETIIMRFLLSGHSFLPNHLEFGDVEVALKVQERLYTDVDYADDFVSVENLLKAVTNGKMDLEKNKVSWLECQTIKLHKEQLTTLMMKSDVLKISRKLGILKKEKKVINLA
ncbi:hypothetical protein ILUMI_05824 [Ignelater luminosus]|uniref:Uncharacterized protein n=1 Tax=Ignelater luminosus TaxID=2038154 RepID=A0A8K0DB79_IGNLU|nr:hypothetical protein ILUMI_05824 [Ignelater luminosus]